MIAEDHSYPSIPPGNSRLPDLALLSDEAFWDYARELARQIPAVEHSPAYLECHFRQGTYFIPLHTLYEVVSPPHSLALLPASPSWMPGIVAWRGDSIATIDLESYLTGTPTEGGAEAILLVAQYGDSPIGLLVSTIGEVRHHLPPAEPSSTATQPGTILDIPSLLVDAFPHRETATRYE